jgi:Ca-activated chloride channel family protein
VNCANPHMLWLLLVIPPALLAFFWWAGRTRQRLLTQFIQTRLLPTLTIGISATRQKIHVGCLVLAVVCLILALARPQWGFDWEEMKQRGLDIVVAIDTSKSMLAEDIAPNRLARAKLAALELMQRARSDRLGLVAFAGSAFLQCPLTIDDAAFRQSVDALNVNIIPQGGTAIAEAIETALTAFKEEDNYKVLVLFTDGEDHDSGALEAAEKAAKDRHAHFHDWHRHAEGELLRIKDAQGGSDYIRDEQGNVVKSHLNERLLQQLAGATEGGFYLPLRGAKAIDTLYDQGLAKLPKSQHQEKLVRRYHEQYHWFLAVAIVLLLVEMLFPERKREPKAKLLRRPPPQRRSAEQRRSCCCCCSRPQPSGVLRRARCANMTPGNTNRRSRNTSSC